MDTVALLLADRSPALRRRALVEIDGASENDPEVVALEDAVKASEEVAAASGRPAAGPIDMSWRLCRLAFLGLRRGHPQVDALAEKIFSFQRGDGSWPDTGPGGADISAGWLAPTEHYEWHPLQTALPLRGICASGWATDPRAERAFEWLLERRVDDGTWAYGKVPNAAPVL